MVISERVTCPLDMEEARRRLAPCLVTLSRRVEEEIREEQSDLRQELRLTAPPGIEDATALADLASCGRILRKLRRIVRHPLPEARRQVRSLASLLEGGEFRELRFSEQSLVAYVEPRPLSPRDRRIDPFRICFVPGDPDGWPMVIERDGPERPLRCFLPYAPHGKCRGDASPILETKMEEFDIYHLFVIAFTWALQNL